MDGDEDLVLQAFISTFEDRDELITWAKENKLSGSNIIQKRIEELEVCM